MGGPHEPSAKTDVLDFEVRDSVAYRPDLGMCMSRWRHTGNGRLYRVQGYVWDSAADRWLVRYTDDECPVGFVQTPERFFGRRDNGMPRFEPA